MKRIFMIIQFNSMWQRCFALLLLLLQISTARAASDDDVFNGLEKLLTAHWKLAAIEYNPAFKSANSPKQLEHDRDQAARALAKLSKGRLTQKDVLKLLIPKSNGEAPDWTPLKALFSQPDLYFLEPYLEPATPRGASTGPQVVSAELGLIQKKETRDIEVNDGFERMEIVRLTQRITNYGGLLIAGKTAGSFVRPGLVVLEDAVVKRMAAAPWSVQERVEKLIGSDYNRGEEEVQHKIRWEYSPLDSLSSLLLWRQYRSTTAPMSERGAEEWLITSCAYRSQLMKDSDLMHVLKQNEDGVSINDTLKLFGDLGALGHSQIPLFIFSNLIVKVSNGQLSASPVGKSYEMSLIDVFCSYLQQNKSKYPQILVKDNEPNKYIVLTQLARLSMDEDRAIFKGAYAYLLNWWLIRHVIEAHKNKLITDEYIKKLDRRLNQASANHDLLLAEYSMLRITTYPWEDAEKTLERLYKLVLKQGGVAGSYASGQTSHALGIYAGIESEHNNLQTADQIYKTVFQLSKNESDAYLAFARHLVRLRKPQEAMDAVNRCLELERQYPPELKNKETEGYATALKNDLSKVLNQK